MKTKAKPKETKISRSGLYVIPCDYCNKKNTSLSKGLFYAQTLRIQHTFNMLLTCRTCKGVKIFPIEEPEHKTLFMKLNTGIVYHCFNQIHKLYLTKDNIILKCIKCGEKQKFKLRRD